MGEGKGASWRSRRRLLGDGLTLGLGGLAATAVPGSAALAQGRDKTLVVAAPATPLSLDVENSLSLGTIDTVAAFYDYLIEFEMMPDPGFRRRHARGPDGQSFGCPAATTSRASSPKAGSSHRTGKSVRFHPAQGR